jgi:hypothetical protein
VSTCAKRLGDFSKGKFCNGGKSSLGERKSQRENRTEVVKSDLVKLYWLGRVGLSLKISEIDKVTKHKFVSHICVDDSSPDLVVSYIYFHIFSV